MKAYHFLMHVDSVVKKCNSRLYLMRKLKSFSVNTEGLKLFYFSMIRSILTYGCPAFYTILSKKDKERLEKVQRTATRILSPDTDGYENRLDRFSMQTLSGFISDYSRHYFSKILGDCRHPLHNKIVFNRNRTSQRTKHLFNPPLCRTEKYRNSFFPYFMSNF
jgi:hypothetical protein